MFKNLNSGALGILARQSELIELTLTFGFRGLDVDMEELLRRAERQSVEASVQFITSARLKIGSFDLPVDFGADEATYQSQLAGLPQVLELAASMDALRAITDVQAGSDELPYHENFERYRRRLSEVAAPLAEKGMSLGLGLLAAPAHREGKAFQFMHRVEDLLMLVKTVGEANVGLNLDLWNWRVGGGGVEQLRGLQAKQIVNVRLADVPAGTDLATITDEQRVMPGDGEGESVALLAVLGELGYDGPVTIYPHGSCFTEGREAVVKAVSAKLSELWEAAGINKAGKLSDKTARV